MSLIEPSEAAIQDWCTEYLARTLEIPRGRIRPDEPFNRLGLDSVGAVSFVADLEEWVGVVLEPEVAFDYPSIAGLARHVVGLLANEQRPG